TGSDAPPSSDACTARSIWSGVSSPGPETPTTWIFPSSSPVTERKQRSSRVVVPAEVPASTTSTVSMPLSVGSPRTAARRRASVAAKSRFMLYLPCELCHTLCSASADRISHRNLQRRFCRVDLDGLDLNQIAEPLEKS